MEPSVIATEIAAEPGALTSLDSASCDLLRAAAGRRTEDSNRRIKELASKTGDWELLIKHADAHGVLPLLFTRLSEARATVPAEAQQRLKADYDRNTFHSLANAAELIKLLDAFNRQGIPAMPFKGVVLAASVYGDLAARSAGDLDLLIHYSDLERAMAVMLENGYQLNTTIREDGSPEVPHFHSHEHRFERQADGMVAELRWRLDLQLGQARFTRNLGLNWVWPRRTTAILAGAEIPNIDAERLLLLLCMHGSKHVWERLLWICDVAQLIELERGINWNVAIREANRTGLWRSLALGALLANRVAGAHVPNDVLNRFASHSGSDRLATHINEHLFDTRGRIPEGLVPYSIRLLGYRDRILSILTLNFLRPNARDFAVIHLPKSLRALYWIVRPFRILGDRSAR